MSTASRRQFLRTLGVGVGTVALGAAFADRLGIAAALAPRWRERLEFGALEPLVDLMQATPADALLPMLVKRLAAGTTLNELVGAAALANARAFGGTNYNGYHALMAMVPAFEMAAQMPAPLAALPVLKVVHRNARFVAEAGRSASDALEPVAATAAGAAATAQDFVASLRQRELVDAEQRLAQLVAQSETAAFEPLQEVMRDDLNVHRVVLAWRAHDLLRITGEQHALTLLRQSARFCIDEDSHRVSQGRPTPEVATLVPKLLDESGLERAEPGRREADDAWIDALANVFYSADGATAAKAAAAALKEGFSLDAVGAALSLAAVRLLLHDPGRSDESPGKPRGSVHGASVGVHASDAANAWRHLARVGSSRNAFASLITGAYHTAGQTRLVVAELFDHDAEATAEKDPALLLRTIEGRIRERDQRGACSAARRYCELGHPAPDLFACLLAFAVSEDGALHSEKFFRTAQEEHALARPAHRSLYLVALTRVMASSAGFPAPGCEEAKRLLTS
jgi:hypothetical protein